MAILLQYNNCEAITMDDLVASLNGNREQLAGVVKVLLKTKLITEDGEAYKVPLPVALNTFLFIVHHSAR